MLWYTNIRRNTKGGTNRVNNSIRRLTVATTLATTFLFNHPSVGESLENTTPHITQKQPSLGLVTSSEDNYITQLKQSVIQAKFKELKAHKEVTKPKNYKELMVTATAYISYCDTGCTGRTATGLNVSQSIRTPEGLGVIAVDPSVIPLGSVVEIGGEKYKALDTGGAIKNFRIDILMGIHNTDRAFEYGTKEVKIKVFK